jgi:hypothetical protein
VLAGAPDGSARSATMARCGARRRAFVDIEQTDGISSARPAEAGPIAACGSGATPTGGAGGAGTGGAGVGGGATLEPGAAAPGWERAYADGSVGIACSMSLDEMLAAGAPSIRFGDTTLVMGFEHVSGNEQDPVVARFDAGAHTYCTYHEAGGPDGRAHGLTWDGGAHAYVVFTVVGGGSGIETATQNGWLPSYGSGGGPKVSVLTRLVTATGEFDAGTFVIAKKKDGKTNTHDPTAAPTKLAVGGVELLGESAFQRGIRASAPGMALDETRWRVAMSLKGSSALRISCCDEETKNAQAEHLQGAPRLGRWQEGRWWAPSAASAAAFACHAASRAPRPKLDECGGARFVRGLAA